ncbi:gene transfer agent family protein [Neorhizobium sp. CSC1952]|uniref:gene transfer agent family protein n=1 Tax=Neorhizobium sp. CSC1952 TaxID=2978974 RepID=UPI0025A59338|nr:gene transfer agent family protein [Rhizobium sp. CSC1952]WJR67655.1 gene transfer agent family protein [Rhizobium sp. CSC1952]
MTEKHYAEIVLPFGDGDYKFCLTFQDVADWEERNERRSLFATFNDMVCNRAGLLSDVRSIVHMGLIGGGMSPNDATAMVRTYVERRPISETLPLAVAIMEAAFLGNDEYRATKGE